MFEPLATFEKVVGGLWCHRLPSTQATLVLPWLGLGIFNKMDITQGGLL